jgi:Metallo-peptidase family M12
MLMFHSCSLLIGSSPSVCGVGFVGGDETFMFSVIGSDCMAGTFAFAHELGHNFGCNHDRGTAQRCGETDTYNFGYRDPGGAFRSIMAYKESAGQCDNIDASNENYHRAQRFSNPDIQYRGQPMGTATENNARVINERRATLASFFPAMNCQYDAECNDNDPATYDSCNLARAVCVFSTLPPRSRPTKPPTPSPTQAPRKPPTNAPTALAALFAPTAPTTHLESMVVPNVASEQWTTVYFRQAFHDFPPVPVCSVQYDLGTDLIPAVVRMTNVGPFSFAIRLQNPSNSTILHNRTVHCLVVGEGAWHLPDGRRLEAVRYTSNVTDHEGSWVGEDQPIPFYANQPPIVLGQVMSYQDPQWSVFWCRGWNRSTSAVPENWMVLATGKHVGKDRATQRAPEMIGYLVLDRGHNTSLGVELETGRGNAAAASYVSGLWTNVTFAQSFAMVPTVAIVSQVGMVGDEGSFAVFNGALTTADITVSVDEDQTTSAERDHAAESVDYAVFSAAGVLPLSSRS